MKRTNDANDLLARLNALSDLVRLRILRLVSADELSVGEIASIVQLPQSTISRHLKLLTETGWLARRPAGTASLYRLSESSLDDYAQKLWSLTQNELGNSATFTQDDRRCAEVIAERPTDSKSFFGRVGGEWDALRSELFGVDFTHVALLSLLPRDSVIADLGCGTGNAAELLAPHVQKLIAVDREPSMLEAARKRLHSFKNIEFRQGELTKLPIDNATVDAAIVVLVMIHVEDPSTVICEAARVLKRGGVLMIVDIVPHEREAYRNSMGHVHLGFSELDVCAWADAAGMIDARYTRMKENIDAKGPGLFVSTMRRPID